MSTYNVKPSAELIELIHELFSGTSLSRCNIGWFVSDHERNPEKSIVDLIMDHLTGDTVLTKGTFDTATQNLNALKNNKKCPSDQSEAIGEAVTLAAPFRDEKSESKQRKAILTSRDQISVYIQSLDKTNQRVLALLAVTTGVTPCDLIRDEYKMTKLSEGRINVGRKLNSRHAGAREIMFDPTLLNDLDPEGEHLEIFSNRAFSSDNIGELGATEFSKILNGTPYNFYQLRASYAVHRRHEDKAEWGVIASELGVKDVPSLVRRIKDYAEANGIILD